MFSGSGSQQVSNTESFSYSNIDGDESQSQSAEQTGEYGCHGYNVLISNKERLASPLEISTSTYIPNINL